jgi:hypothetical protein
VMELVKFTRVEALVVATATICLSWIPVYATLAFRRVYGGSYGATLTKEIGIGGLHAVMSAIGFTLMIYWVSLVG